LQITLPHEITYDFDGRASIPEIVASLSAQERLVKEAAHVFAACFHGLEVSELRVALREVQQESPLKELLSLSLVLAFQDDLEHEVPEIVTNLTGVQIPDQYDSLVTVFVMIAAIYGASFIYEKFKKGHAAKSIPNDYDKLINVAGDYINVPADEVRNAVEQTLGKSKKQAIARASKDFFLAAKRNGARAIKSSAGFEISKGTIEEFPSDVDMEGFEPESEEYLLEGVVVEFHAHDRDVKTRGWAAVVPDVSERRTRLHIDPTIETEGLFVRSSVKGDVLVFSVQRDNGEYEPKLYYLQNVYDG